MYPIFSIFFSKIQFFPKKIMFCHPTTSIPTQFQRILDQSVPLLNVHLLTLFLF
jgi:hypothetical protein